MTTTWSNDWFHISLGLGFDGSFKETIELYDYPGVSFDLVIDGSGTVLEQSLTYFEQSLRAEPFYFVRGIFTGKGPIFEELETQNSRLDDAYNRGFSDGYEISVGSDGKTVPVEIDPEVLKNVTKLFPDWVSSQEMKRSAISCGAHVKMDVPLPSSETFSAFVANHDCSDRDLLFTIVLN